MTDNLHINIADARAYGAAFGILAANAQAAADAFQNAFTMAIHQLAGRPTARPRIVCLCGSTRFIEAFREANLSETLAGRIVLSIGCDMRSDADLFADHAPDEIAIVKTNLDELHKRKIDLADEVLILNVGGYIGDSTRSEIAYAERLGKPIRWLENPAERAAEANQERPLPVCHEPDPTRPGWHCWRPLGHSSTICDFVPAETHDAYGTPITPPPSAVDAQDLALAIADSNRQRRGYSHGAA